MRRILLIEDNEMNRDMLTRRLARKGYEVTVALDGKEGLEIAQTIRPDLILMDITLPIMDGTEVVKKLKANSDTQAIPVIALTGHAMESDRQLALSLGFNDYDTKPVDLARLLEKIEAQLAKKEGEL